MSTLDGMSTIDVGFLLGFLFGLALAGLIAMVILAVAG